MRDLNKGLISKNVYSIIKNEWKLPQNLRKIRNFTLLELGVTNLDINCLLNELEWKYQLEINEEIISPTLTIEGFINQVVSQVQLVAYAV